jgi:hypothetical protein
MERALRFCVVTLPMHKEAVSDFGGPCAVIHSPLRKADAVVVPRCSRYLHNDDSAAGLRRGENLILNILERRLDWGGVDGTKTRLKVNWLGGRMFALGIAPSVRS